MTLSHPYVNSFEAPPRGSFFARTIVPAARERARGKCTPTPKVARGKEPRYPPSQSSGWTYATGNVERQIRQKARNVHATVHAGGVGRMGVAQLLSAVKPANRGSQTPLRTAARSYLRRFAPSQSLPHRASNLPSAQFIARRTWSFLAFPQYRRNPHLPTISHSDFNHVCGQANHLLIHSLTVKFITYSLNYRYIVLLKNLFEGATKIHAQEVSFYLRFRLLSFSEINESFVSS